MELPDGTYNPTNYSGTQINFWGVSPNAVPQMLNGTTGGYSGPYGNRPTQLGLMTESMIRVNIFFGLLQTNLGYAKNVSPANSF